MSRKRFTASNVESFVKDDNSDTRKSVMYMMGSDDMEVSDGYHTFAELYDHRIALFVSLCRWLASETTKKIWRSKLHSDGSGFDGWFILGINTEAGNQITYHLPLSYWDETEFAETLEKAPPFDGHTPADVITRLKTI